MKIQTVPINSLQMAAYNPRKELQEEDKEYQDLKSSMAEFGYVEAIVWNESTGNVVGGHQRLRILLAQGATEVEVSVVNLDPEKEKALNVALNKISGSWDYDKLSELMQDLVEHDLASFTGFSEKEIDDMLKDIESGAESDQIGGGSSDKGSSFNYCEQYGVIVMCENESAQREIYENLVSQGYECKVVAT